MTARTVEDVVLGEATYGSRAERYADMVAIASAIANRASRYGVTPDSIVSAVDRLGRTQFNAYGKSLPAGASQYRELARQAIAYVNQNGPVHNATYYATPAATKNLPKGLKAVTTSPGHVFYDDPQGRAILTADGYKSASKSVSLPDTAPVPERRPANINRAVALPASVRGPGMMALTPSLQAGERVEGNGIGYRHPERGSVMDNLSEDARASLSILATNTPGGVNVTSAYRSPSINRNAGGAAESQHMKGKAFDLDLSNMTPEARAKVVEYARLSGATRMGTYTNTPDMLHVDFGTGYDPKADKRAAEYSADVWPMHDKTVGKMASAPEWFKAGLSQSTFPTPTARPPDSLTPAPSGRIDRAPLTPPVQSLPQDRPMPSGPLKPGNQAVPRPGLGVDRLMPSGPVRTTPPTTPTGTVEPGGALPIAYASLQSSRPSPVPAVPTGNVTRAPLEPVVPPLAALASAPAGVVQRAALPPVTPMAGVSAASPARALEDIRNVAGPKGTFNVEAPTAPPALQPVPVLAPALAPPRVVQPRPVYDVPQDVFPAAPPPPPAATPGDVWAGRAPSAMSSSGNALNRDEFGRVAITNKYGATTIHGPDGSVGAGSIGGPLNTGGIQPQTSNMFGPNAKKVVGGAVGAGLGGLLAGPFGAVVGGLLARDVAMGQPLGSGIRGLLGGTNSFQVMTPNGMQTQKYAAPNPRLNKFPDAPAPMKGVLDGSNSNLSRSEMESISPKAAADIAAGRQGLF